MYNVEKLVEEGKEIMYNNPRRMISAFELVNQRDKHGENVIDFGNDMFLIGLAIGARIGANKNSGLAEGNP